MSMHASLNLHNIVKITVTKPYHLEGTNSNTLDVVLEGKDGTTFTVSVYSKTADDLIIVNLGDKA